MSSDLTNGNIKKQILMLSLPVVVTSFVRMINNFVDMFWMKQGVGDDAIAAIGVGGLLIWFFVEIGCIFEIGTQVKVSTLIGEGKNSEGDVYAKSGMITSFCVALLLVVFTMFFGKYFIGIYDLTDVVADYGLKYIYTVALGIPFMFINYVITGMFHAKGNTKITFIVNSISLVSNMVLDPIFIFGFDLGIVGAGLATSLAQVIGTVFFIFATRGQFVIKGFIYSKKATLVIVKIGFPNFIYRSIFVLTSMFITGVVSSFGTNPVAVQQIGTQLEAISWMTAGGLRVAISSFIGQNFGAKKYSRILSGFRVTITYGIILGTINCFLFFFFGENIIKIFLTNDEAIAIGANFMRISSLSQFFMCIEIVTVGAFLGLSKPLYSSVSNVVCTLIRIPLVLFLTREDVLGVDGVWWTITISCMLKGIFINILYLSTVNKKIKREAMNEVAC